ncbi:MAG TPA: hypothetical protein VE756_14815, partial [Burkholderiales bacterium]|nr:hypothetical protein [Burkholderiales bacterium]
MPIQHLEDAPQGRGIDVAVNSNAALAAELDHHYAIVLRRLSGAFLRRHTNRDKGRCCNGR